MPIVDTVVLEVSVRPGETQYQSIVQLIVYERGKSRGAGGYNANGEGRWGQVSGLRPDKEFKKWLLEILTPYKPSQPLKTVINKLNIKDRWDIEVERLVLSTPELGETDERILDDVLKTSPKPDWFDIFGDPDIGLWSIIVKIDEPGFVVAPEDVRREKESALQQPRQSAVRQYQEVMTLLAQKLGHPVPIIDIVVCEFLSANGFSDPFDIQLANFDEARQAIERIRHLRAEDLKPYIDLGRRLRDLDGGDHEV